MKTVKERAQEAEERQATGEGLKTRQEAGAKGGRGKKAGSDTTSFGRDVDYLTARIARDHPQVLERMKAGEFPSNDLGGGLGVQAIVQNGKDTESNHTHDSEVDWLSGILQNGKPTEMKDTHDSEPGET